METEQKPNDDFFFKGFENVLTAKSVKEEDGHYHAFIEDGIGNVLAVFREPLSNKVEQHSVERLKTFLEQDKKFLAIITSEEWIDVFYTKSTIHTFDKSEEEMAELRKDPTFKQSQVDKDLGACYIIEGPKFELRLDEGFTFE